MKNIIVANVRKKKSCVQNNNNNHKEKETIEMENKVNETTEEILDEIECNIYPQGDDTWGVTAECDRDYLGEYIKAKLYELLECTNEQ